MGAGGALAGMGIGDIFGMDDNIRQKVFEVGMEHFLNTSEDIDKINEIGYEIFDNEILAVQEFLNSLISQCDSRIKTIDKKAKQDQEQNSNSVKNINQIISDLQQISFSFD